MKYGEAIDAGLFHAGSACIDCVMVLANGETENPDSGWNESAMRATFQEYDVTLGHFHSGKYSTCYHSGTECEDDCDCEHTEFSNSACSVCGTTIAGSRDDVTLVRWDTLKGDAL